MSFKLNEVEQKLLQEALTDLIQKTSESRPKVTRGTCCPTCNGSLSHWPTCTGECPLSWTLEDEGRRKNVAKHFYQVTRKLNRIKTLLEWVETT